MKPLISASELQRRLQKGGVVVFDCRHRLSDPGWGVSAFRAGHVPGARHLHLDRDLSAPVAPDLAGGRHPLPDPELFGRLLRAHGVSRRTRVVAYDDMGNPFAARLWWMLRWLGHDDVQVLDGGLNAWAGPLEEGDAAPVREGSFQPRLRPELVAGREDAADAELLVDCRAPARFRGEVEPLDPRPGHIPGAINRFWRELVDEAGRLARPPQLPPGEPILYCGSGVTACVGLLALEAYGGRRGRLYPGSWSGWLAAGGPVEKGPA